MTETSAKASNLWFGLVKVNLHCSGAPGGAETAANDDAKLPFASVTMEPGYCPLNVVPITGLSAHDTVTPGTP